ncbi:MAG TPA: hypothetical protein VLA34_06845 [Candidatus Krumholzibacterium sp.]|nr:hypothetical protein [Candidatus Krumholzibacterium sp.]
MIIDRTVRTPLARIVLLVAVLAMTTGGCRKRIFTGIDLPDDDPAAGSGLSVAAVYLTDAGEIDDLFGAFLPERGVLPVLVALRNNDTVPLRLHSRNGLPAGGRYVSLLLEGGGLSLEPLHPLEVVMAGSGGEKEPSYKEIGKGETAAGVFFPPLGAWYVWKEYEARREYKPLIRSSLLPARFGGLFDPLEIAPGGEVSGFLYFPLDSARDLYEQVEVKVMENEKEKTRTVWRLKESPGADLTLRVIPSLTETSEKVHVLGTGDEGEVREVLFARSPAWSGESSGVQGIFRITELQGEEHLAWTALDGGPVAGVAPRASIIERFSGTGVSIADAEVHGDRGVVAVNFTRRTKVLLLDLSHPEARVVSSRSFDRKTERVMLTADNAFAVTSDGVCREIPEEDGRAGKYVKLGTGVHETFISGDGDLVAFCSGEISVFDLSAGGLFDRIAERPRHGPGADVVSGLGGLLVMHVPGDGNDTMTVFDTSKMEVVSRTGLRGKVAASGPVPGGAVVQMENGTVLVFRVSRPDGVEPVIGVERSFYMDEIQEGMAGSGGSIMIYGEDRQVRFGRFDPWLPLPCGTESSVRVEPSAVTGGDE